MKILSICSYFGGSKVHANLIHAIDEIGIEQTVYSYSSVANNKNAFKGRSVSFVFRDFVKPIHRVILWLKLRIAFKDITQSLPISSFDIIHASTLFSDGGLAYLLNKQYRTPYLVAIRSTDVDVFLKWRVLTWGLGRRILKNASKIVFISPSLQKHFCQSRAIRRILPELTAKMVVIPNGIDDYWLDNKTIEKRSNREIIYVGTFIPRKKVPLLIQSVHNLLGDYPDIKLHLVGGGGGDSSIVSNLVKQYPEWLFFHGRISNKDELRGLYRNCGVFAMPSDSETFGLVYLEALTQNLALLYVKDQGIDGLIDSKIGEAISDFSVSSVAATLKTILGGISLYGNQEVDFERFRWSRIASVYISIYKSLLA